MADDSKMNGEFSDDRALDISGYETPDSDSKTSALNERIAALEQENRQLVHEKEVIEKRVDSLKESIEEANKEKESLLQEAEKSKAEVRTLEAVAARAAELEGEVSRLQHDLISTMSAMEEANSELSGVKTELEGVKKSENEKRVELEAVVKERDLLMEKLEKLEALGSENVKEINEKEKEIRGLREKIEELKVVVAKNGDENKELEGVRSELEGKVKEMEGKVLVLEAKLDVKERVIDVFEAKEREVMDGGINGKAGVDGEGKVDCELVGERKVEWPVVAGSIVGAVGLVGVVCYLRYAKRT